LFAGTNAVGERAPAISSLIGTAKLNSIDPQPYLRRVLTRIDKLLPWSLTAEPSEKPLLAF
jgi:transposase